ncbi:hypothetical protein CyaNS01_02935 [Cyanobium sp. NS01]|nr:hypothetical protein CyaNS01_02935 [Cyanobium sp. NS01]
MARRGTDPSPRPRQRGRARLALPGLTLLLGLGLAACGGGKEVAIQNAKAGDALVQVEGTRVDLALDFQPGVSNGLYKGAVRLFGPDQPEAGSLLAVNAVCSLEDTPGWPPYDNLYGRTIKEPAEARDLSGQSNWQILYYFDGKVEASGTIEPQPWAQRLKDNLCRRGDFDDSTAREDTTN